jgi:hypothetical protein
VLDVDAVLLVPLKVLGVRAQRDPRLANAATALLSVSVFRRTCPSPGHQERAEKTKAAHDQAANVSLENLVAGDLVSATSSRFGSTTVRLYAGWWPFRALLMLLKL